MPASKKSKPFSRHVLFVVITGIAIVAAVILKLTLFEITWKTYNSPRGYTIQYPQGWQIDPTRAKEPYERIVSPKEEVVLAISVYEDKNAPTEKGFQSFIDEIRQSYANNTEFTLLSLDPSFHPGEYVTGEYVTASIRKKPSGQTYEQTEIGIVTKGSHIYILTANVDTQVSKKYDNVVKEVFLRFKPILK